MKRKQALGQSSLMEEVQTRNRQLTEKLDLMERQMAKRLAKSVEVGLDTTVNIFNIFYSKVKVDLGLNKDKFNSERF